MKHIIVKKNGGKNTKICLKSAIKNKQLARNNKDTVPLKINNKHEITKTTTVLTIFFCWPFLKALVS